MSATADNPDSPGLLLAWYGDDFTGSADVMEVLQWAGLASLLFLDPPSPEQLARHGDLRAFGIAGWSRTMSPQEMDAELRPALVALAGSGAPLVHYKICSTGDSSPQIGSIGKALEIGRDLFGPQPVPILVGAPQLGRYTVFGNVFARSGLDSEPFRLDRHPTMSRHPITPMDEADFRVHLARQTSLEIALFDLLRLADRDPLRRLDELLAASPATVLLDVLYPEHLPVLGQVIQRLHSHGQWSRSAAPSANAPPTFLIGSSGIEYALTAWWQTNGTLPHLQTHAAGRPTFGPVEQLLVLTGSCSPVNDRQIAWALDRGFAEVPLDTPRLVDPATREATIDSAIRRATELLASGRSVIVHSSRGPHDPRVAETLAQYSALGYTAADVQLKNGRTLGPPLGRIVRGVLQRYPLRRVGIAGGDTSGFVARELGITALGPIAPVAPGSPLCRIHARAATDGLEILFKGGQVGKDDVWGTLLGGTAD